MAWCYSPVAVLGYAMSGLPSTFVPDLFISIFPVATMLDVFDLPLDSPAWTVQTLIW